MTSMKQRLSIFLLIGLIMFLSISKADCRPAGDDEANSVAEAIRYLQDLENKHAQYARPSGDGVSIVALISILEHLDKHHGANSRPRFGKRNNGNVLTKEFPNGNSQHMRYLPDSMYEES
ncbi:unnamed protein product [Diamesa hyperborea]